METYFYIMEDIGKHDALIKFICTHFQPCNWVKIFIFMFINLSSLDECIMMMEEPQALPLEGTFDISVYCWLTYDGDNVYMIPIQSCIEESCRRTFHPLQGFDDDNMSHAF